VTTEFAPTLKLIAHPEAVRAALSGDWKAPPVGVEIAPTNHCSAKCPWCFYVASEYKQKHSKEHLSFGLLHQALVQMAQHGVKSVTWTGGGDPCDYPWINEAIHQTNANGLLQGMFTNAYKPVLEPEKLDWIRVTVTEKFIITKHVAEYAKKTKVGVNYNLCTENYPHLREMVEVARDAGVRYFQVRPALADRWDLQKEVYKPEWLERYETDTFRVVMTDYKWDDYLKPHGYDKCHGHRLVPFLWHDGSVAVCAYHYGRDAYTFGNLRDGGWRAVWEGERRRRMLEEGVGVIRECQHCCKLHELNKPLAALLGGGVEDREFL
jgi:sulfatase maturation enzyme AslB (radical SAM superfamily)